MVFGLKYSFFKNDRCSNYFVSKVGECILFADDLSYVTGCLQDYGYLEGIYLPRVFDAVCQILTDCAKRMVLSSHMKDCARTYFMNYRMKCQNDLPENRALLLSKMNDMLILLNETPEISDRQASIYERSKRFGDLCPFLETMKASSSLLCAYSRYYPLLELDLLLSLSDATNIMEFLEDLVDFLTDERVLSALELFLRECPELFKDPSFLSRVWAILMNNQDLISGKSEEYEFSDGEFTPASLRFFRLHQESVTLKLKLRGLSYE